MIMSEKSFNSFSAFSGLFGFLPPIKTGPNSPSTLAVSSPIPEVPPVTT